MTKFEYKDELSFIDPDTGDQLIFNFKTWLSVIKGIIVEFGNKTQEEANALVEKRNFLIPESYIECIFYSHDVEYHWALLVLHGDQYWNRGISPDEPEDYDKWDFEFRKKHSLKEESFEFL